MIAHPRIYHLHPLLAGPVEGSHGADWHGHLDRLVAMNFDCVLLAPFHQPGACGNIYAVHDPYALHPVAAGSSDKSADALLGGFISAAQAQDVQVMMDVALHQCAADAPLVSEHPEWYRSGLSAELPDAAGDVVFADFDSPDGRAGLIAYWVQYLQHYLRLGVGGFRCIDTGRLSPHVWEEVLAGVREGFGESTFIADTLGCAPEEVRDLAGAGFDLVLNSARWWDFHSPWLLEQYETLRRFAPSIAFPEQLESGRLGAELTAESPDDAARHYRLRYLFTALFSAGVMMPMGYEFGFRQCPDPVNTRPENWETPRFDIGTFVAGANALKADCPSLHTEGPQNRLDAPFGAPVSILQLSGEIGERGCALILINPSADPAGVDPAFLLAQVQGTYDSYSEVTPDRAPVTLRAGEPLIVEPLGLRVFRGDYAAAQDHLAGLAGAAPSDEIIRGVVGADNEDPFAVRGMHAAGPNRTLVVRAFVPGADSVEVIQTTNGKSVATLERRHEDGFFAGSVGSRTRPFKYRLRITEHGNTYEIEDPYRFPPTLGEMDRYLLGEGTHLRAYEKLGAHVISMDGVDGVVFSVWAPNARRVAVVGDFNSWDGRRHPMRLHPGSGLWEIFVPGAGAGSRYKFEIKGAHGQLLPLKADPYGLAAEMRPNTASIVHGDGGFQWSDESWYVEQAARNARDAPVSIYEAHLGSWRREAEGNRYLTYRKLAEQLVPYVADMGFTHIELLPVSEHPFDGSWGYQPIGLFAPTSRFGTPDDFSHFVDACHRSGIGVLLDWVPGHFPTDPHGLALFDGTALYEHADPRQGFHQDWNTMIYNFGRNEVRNYLINSALFWLDRYHVDGLRVDAVASMLYLDYSRKAGEWIPNRYGGNENLEAIDLMKKFNELLYERFPGAMTVAEESTSWPGVSRPSYLGGLGFGYKWNMGWMHDTLEYMKRDPVYRRYHHNQITFSLAYAFSENFVLPLSHDEVVHGKHSILGRMPGDDWQKFANLRSYYGFMWTHPGKKLMFMGCEFAQGREWNHDAGLDWHLLEIPWHAGVQRLVRDLNHLYRAAPALHQRDCEPEGFDWIEANDADHSILAFQRNGAPGAPPVIVVCNFTPVPRPGYRVGVPAPGPYAERINTDAEVYGGSGVGNLGGVHTEPVPCQNRPQSIVVTVPPAATVIFELDNAWTA